MKQSELYRKAAELVFSNKARYACHAIYMLKHKKQMSMKFFDYNDPESLAIAYLFQNQLNKNTLVKGVFGNPDNRKTKELRINALCLMSAIAKSDNN
jgi:hypothetical protein